MSSRDENVNRNGGGFSPDLVYSRGELRRITGLGLAAFDEMEADGGLERIQPTSKIFFHGGDVLEAMRELTRKKRKPR